MKLPDFLGFRPFNDLRQSMGANELGDFNLAIPVSTISFEEIKQLESNGIEVNSLDAIIELEDGTLAYKDTRILLYIRDINVSNGRYSQGSNLPKFHVSWCKTLNHMHEDKRFDRYVLSTRTDGIFEIRKTGKYSNDVTTTNESLDVCKNCLDKLHFEGYSHGSNKIRNDQIFRTFTINKFFEKFPRSPLNLKPKPRYTSATAPTDVYPANFGEITERTREKSGWKCEECGMVLDHPELRRYLHTHHINGRKHDNKDENLQALCIACHADLPAHEMMKSTPDYYEFERLARNQKAVNL